MGDIENINSIIQEVALPKVESGRWYGYNITSDTRSMADHLKPARDTLREKVLPLIREAIQIDEDLYRQLEIASRKSGEATEIVHNVLDGTKTQADYDALVEPARQALDDCEPSLRSSTEYVAKVEASLIGLIDSLDSSYWTLHRQAADMDRNTLLNTVYRDLENMQL